MVIENKETDLKMRSSVNGFVQCFCPSKPYSKFRYIYMKVRNPKIQQRNFSSLLLISLVFVSLIEDVHL